MPFGRMADTCKRLLAKKVKERSCSQTTPLGQNAFAPWGDIGLAVDDDTRPSRVGTFPRQ